MKRQRKKFKGLSRGKKAALIAVVVLCYAGLIGLGLKSYEDSYTFLAVLAVTALLPPVLVFGLMHHLSGQIDALYREIDKHDDDEEDGDG